MARLAFLVTISLHICLVLVLLVSEGLSVAPRNYLDSLEQGAAADVQQLKGSLLTIEFARTLRPTSAELDLISARLQLRLGSTVAGPQDMKAVHFLLREAQAKRPSWGEPVSDQARLLIKRGLWDGSGRKLLELSLRFGPREYFLLRRYLTLGALYYQAESESFRRRFVDHLGVSLKVRYQLDLVRLLVQLRLEEAVYAALMALDDGHPLKTVYQEQMHWMLSVRDAPSV